MTGFSTAGDVRGENSSIDNAITKYDGTTGKLIQDSGVTIDDDDNVGVVESIKLNTSGTAPYEAGRIKWGDVGDVPVVDSTEADLHLPIVENSFKVKNLSGAILPQLSVVRPIGATGGNPTVELADASDFAKSRPVGLMRSVSTNDNAIGYVTIQGILAHCDTSTWPEGTKLYLSETPGLPTSVKPSYPSYPVRIGVVSRSDASEGTIIVDSDPEHDLNQDLSVGASPTFDGTNFTNVSADDVNLTDSENEFNATEAEAALKELAEKTDVNGYDRYDTDSMPDVTLSTRTISVAVKGGQSSFHFWTNNKKIIKTTTQSVEVPDVTGAYYIYFDDSGVLQYILQSSVTSIAFYKFAITAFIYWNASNSTALFNPDEQHGKDMAGVTHESMHMTVGARYSMGLEIEGLADESTTYTQSTWGMIYDEDIPHVLSANSTGHKMLYRWGADGAWRTTTADLAVGHTEGGSYYTWNEWDGSTWKWTEGTSSTDYWITFFLATPTGVIKIAGQNAYPSRSDAREAIETEIENISTTGLPSPEMVWLGAVIVRRNGDLENLSDGSLFYNLKQLKGGGGTPSGTSYASDVPTDITNFDNNLSATDTDVQTALDTIDDMTLGIADVVDDTTPQLGGELDAQAHSIGFTLQSTTGDGTTTIDWKLGNKFKFTFGAQNETFTFTAPTKTGAFQLIIIQDGTGSRTATWPTVKWAGGTAPTLSTDASSIDIVSFLWDGTNWYGTASLAFA